MVWFFKSCLPQVLFDPFLNTLTHMWKAEIKKFQGCFPQILLGPILKYFWPIYGKKTTK